jgi:hypothetical protein
MTDKQIIIDENICEYYSDEKEDEEGANPIVGWCNDNYCKCEDVPLDECVIKAVQFCKLKDKQLKAKEQECERLKETFDGLLKVQYKLADNNKKLRQCLTEIKEIAETAAKCMYATYSDDYTEGYSWLGRIILQKISECEVK